MHGLYAIVDTETLERHGLDPCRFAEALLAARPAAIQLRDKDRHDGGHPHTPGGARRTLALLRSIAPLAARAGVPLFANDRPDLALLARCDGVHVGQEDVPVRLVRSIAAGFDGGHPHTPALRVGLSTHDAGQVEQALEEGPDYLAIGPNFPTASKDRPSPVVGLGVLASLSARVRAARPGLPVVAIGGIGLETAGAVGVLADAVAVIGALVPEERGPAAYDWVEGRARSLHAAIVGGSR
jgi:thiamine-phosphate pyrophosphorylase